MACWQFVKNIALIEVEGTGYAIPNRMHVKLVNYYLDKGNRSGPGTKFPGDSFLRLV